MLSTEILIVGAGPTGLGAAYALSKSEKKIPFMVVDRGAEAGGLASSFQDTQGFWWDVGGHILFSHYEEFDDMLDRVLPVAERINHQRRAFVYTDSGLVPYPLQKNLGFLPKDIQWECVKGLLQASLHRPPSTQGFGNLEDFLLSNFGEGISRFFLIPYNEKVWSHRCTDLSTDWLGERVAQISLEDSLKSIVYQQEERTWGPNSFFFYPRRGGIGQIWRNLADQIGGEQFLYGRNLTEIDWKKRRAKFDDGTLINYETLFSTIPLDSLLRIIKPVLPTVSIRNASALSKTSSHIVGVGLRGQPPELLSKVGWMYFSQADLPFYRVTVLSNYSPHQTPDSGLYWSLLAETSASVKMPRPTETILEATIHGLRKLGFIESLSDVASTWVHHAEYGYPVPSINRDTLLQKAHEALANCGNIHSRGRFGGWKYEVSNQDHSFHQGLEWVQWLTLGKEEITFHSPSRANQGVFRSRTAQSIEVGMANQRRSLSSDSPQIPRGL